MADQRRNPKVALPRDLVRVVYEVGIQKGLLGLKDRLQALTVCRAWKEALSSLPIRCLALSDGEEDKELWKWVIQRRPIVASLELKELHNARALAVLAAVQCNGLTSLDWQPPGRLHVADTLPRAFAARFPSLRQLDLSHLVVGSTWLRELGSLRCLKTLRLTFQELNNAATAGDAVRFPSLPSLAHLSVGVWPGPPELHIQLDGLPALTELELEGGRVAVQASRPPPQLKGLGACAEHLAVDFAALLSLKSATFSTEGQLEAPASIAAATALTYLQLDEWGPSALQLLCSLPPSVRCISVLDSELPQEAADLVGNMTGLVGLELNNGGPVPAEDAPLWAGLRAFAYCLVAYDVEAGDVLKGLRYASKLEVLQVHLDLQHPDIQLMDMVTSLPALRKLLLHIWDYHMGPVGQAVFNVSRRAMPHVEILLINTLARSSSS